jgi:hypothetical protein
MGRQTLDVCTPDSPRPWFGEMSLWLRQPRAADAAALERSLVLSLQMREFDRFTALMPAFKRVCEVEAGAFAVLNHLSLVQAGTHPGARSAISPLAKRSKTVRLPADGSTSGSLRRAQTQPLAGADEGDGIIRLISERPTGGGASRDVGWGGLRYGAIWAGMTAALLKIEEQRQEQQEKLTPAKAPKGSGAMSMLKLFGQSYSKAQSVSTISVNMLDYGGDY